MKIFLLIFIFIFSFIQIKAENISIDSNRYVILKFDKKEGFLFNKKFNPTDINKKEIESILFLIRKAVSDYNFRYIAENNLQKLKNKEIDLSNYKIQLIPVVNPLGEKEIFVNCICLQSREIANLKNGLIVVMDGGKCYFHLKINLNKNLYFDFVVNGEA